MLKLVADLVGLDKVRSQLQMITLRREFLQERDKTLAAAQGMFPFFSFRLRSTRIDQGDVCLGIPQMSIGATAGSSLPRPSTSSDDASPGPLSDHEEGWHTEDGLTSPRYVWALYFGRIGSLIDILPPLAWGTQKICTTTRSLSVPRQCNVPKVSETTHDHRLSSPLTDFATPEVTSLLRATSPEETDDTY